MDADTSYGEESRQDSFISEENEEKRVDSPMSTQCSNAELLFDRSVLEDPAIIRVVLRKIVQPFEQPTPQDSIFQDPAVLHTVVKERRGIYQDPAVLHATVKRAAQQIQMPAAPTLPPLMQLYARQRNQYAAAQQYQYYNQYGMQQSLQMYLHYPENGAAIVYNPNAGRLLELFRS